MCASVSDVSLVRHDLPVPQSIRSRVKAEDKQRTGWKIMVLTDTATWSTRLSFVVFTELSDLISLFVHPTSPHHLPPTPMISCLWPCLSLSQDQILACLRHMSSNTSNPCHPDVPWKCRVMTNNLQGQVSRIEKTHPTVAVELTHVNRPNNNHGWDDLCRNGYGDHNELTYSYDAILVTSDVLHFRENGASQNDCSNSSRANNEHEQVCRS